MRRQCTHTTLTSSSQGSKYRSPVESLLIASRQNGLLTVHVNVNKFNSFFSFNLTRRIWYPIYSHIKNMRNWYKWQKDDYRLHTFTLYFGAHMWAEISIHFIILMDHLCHFWWNLVYFFTFFLHDFSRSRHFSFVTLENEKVLSSRETFPLERRVSKRFLSANVFTCIIFVHFDEIFTENVMIFSCSSQFFRIVNISPLMQRKTLKKTKNSSFLSSSFFHTLYHPPNSH